MRETIARLLEQFRGLEPLKRLFWQELNYDRVNTPIPIRDWDAERGLFNGDPLLLAEHGDFKIIYGQMRGDLSRTAERVIANRLLQNYPYALFVFSDHSQTHWQFVNVKYDRDTAKRRIFRRITVEPGERLRTATERIGMLDLETISRDLFGIPPLAIQQRHDQAFDVEAVTNAFYNDYRKQFNALQNALTETIGNREWAHDYALQFINRVMFLYFVQRKRWLKNDPEFLKNLWREYRDSQQEAERFVPDWLNVLFFEAFNNRFGRRAYFSTEVNEALVQAPYLNGGLFRENNLDRAYDVALTDAQFESLFEMLERYNFTIREDSPLDQEVAVDPEMIGKVYESLVNLSTEADERGDIGIFYTPRTEIDLMCRLTLVDHLSQRLGELYRSTLYEFVFAIEPQAKQHVDDTLVPQNLWQPLFEALRSLTVIDPACGSGAFLVGMLAVLDDLNERANRRIGEDELPSERKRRIIRDSIYGVDVMGWAVDIAELRLWLQLVVDTDYALAELQLRPLLPDLSFKVRQGDSLVQEVAGINLSVVRGNRDIPPPLKGRITQLKGEKLKAYRNEDVSQRKFKTAQAIRDEELAIFRDLFAHRCATLESRIKEFSATQSSMFGAAATTPAAQLAALEAELTQAKAAHNALQTARDVPFVWEIAFVEIFEGERGGFDIVVGNPPYVRQERIADPLQHRDTSTATERKRYKDKLARSVYQRYPAYFGLNQRTGKTSRTLSSKSDLYIYFFFHGLNLLNDQGSFCFVTSNSWLDVGYGADLQEFLLRQGHVRLMLDNKSRRTFANADVNSAIALLGPVQDVRQRRDAGLNNTARFVLFAVPFEEVLDADVWKRIEAVTERTVVSDHDAQQFRVYPVTQKALLEDGMAISSMDDEASQEQHKAGEYAGNKWGGKYLRAPDIYFVVREKGRDKLAQLSETCDVEGYIHDNNTGPSFPPVRFLKTIKLVDTIRLTSSSPGVIQYGVKDTGNSRLVAPLLFARTYGTRHLVLWNTSKVYGKEFYKIIPRKEDQIISVAAQMNSTLAILQRELIGLVNLGDGAIKFSGDDIRQFLLLSSLSSEMIEKEFNAIANRTVLNVADEITLPDRRALDEIVFEVLGLTQSERDAVYEAVIDLVDARLKKAASFKMVKAIEE